MFYVRLAQLISYNEQKQKSNGYFLILNKKIIFFLNIAFLQAFGHLQNFIMSCRKSLGLSIIYKLMLY